ncbi:MAG: DNA internalization-related competence protein ComEC/Rec2 [Bacteroidota bacterium]
MPSSPPLPPFCWTARPMLTAALLFGGGIALATHLGAPLRVWLFVTTLLWIAAMGLALAPRRRLVTLRPLALTGLTLSLILVAGAARYATWDRISTHSVAHVAAWSDSTRVVVTLWGTVAEAPVAARSGTRLWLDVDSAATEGPAALVTGRMQVALRQARYGTAATYPTLSTGDYLEVTSLVSPLPTKRNPADFDYGAYLRRQNVHATLALYDADALAVLGSEASLLQRATAAAQQHVRASIAAHVGTPEARSLLYALLLADRSALDPETQDAFRQTGLMHLLAVSGLHVLLVGLALFHLLKPLLLRVRLRWRAMETTRALVTLMVLGGYVLLTGAPISVVRAFVMAALFIAGGVLQRQTDALNTLGLAAVVLLVLRPAALFDVGFQLSFSAVTGLVLLTPLAERWTPARWWQPSRWRWALQSTNATIAATLATAPVLAYHFGAVPLAGLVLNLVAIHLTAAVLLAGLLTVATAGWADALATAYGGAVELGAALLLGTAEVGNDWLGVWTFTGFVRNPWLVAAGVAALLTLTAWSRPRWRWRIAVFSAALAVVAAGAPALTGDDAPRLDVVFFDVGQGDATLLVTPRGRTVLIDAGVRDDFSDQGAWTILPHLQRHGIDRLDALVLTHAHADHYGGAQALLEALPVGTVYTNGLDSDADLWRGLLAAAAAHNVPIVTPAGGTMLDLDPSVRMQWLHASAASFSDANEASLALRVVHGVTSWLFTGDGEAQAEAYLVARYGSLLASDVVQVGHHGSRTSSTPAFVEHVTMEDTRAVVSVGRRNRYRLPHAEVIERWEHAGAKVAQTADVGAVWLRSDGTAVEEVAWR